MLIDINAHVGSWPFQQLKYNTCKALLERMDDFGVDISVISNINGIFYKNTQAGNEELHEELMSNRKFKDRFIPFAVINPMYAGWEYDLETCGEKMNIKGIRLYPKFHDYDLTEPSCIKLVKNARDRGLTIAFTLRMLDTRGPRHWMDLKTEWALADVMPIIKAVPDAKYFILNIANSVNLKEEDFELFKMANILMDTSGRRISDLRGLLNTYGNDKFAFGTHSPILDYVTGLLRIEALRETEVDENTRNRLRSGNAQKFLGIQS